MANMQTMREYANQTPDYAYFGDSDDWKLAYAIHRDSDVLERSNFEALKRIAGDWAIVETDSHWLVGHAERLLIDPEAPQEIVEAIETALEDLEDYPLVDEELYSDMEYEEACETAESALYELGVPLEQRKDAASYVVRWGRNGGKDDYAYSGVRDYWPSKQAQFWGYVNYRRSLRF